jgi:hypothetical protein
MWTPSGEEGFVCFRLAETEKATAKASASSEELAAFNNQGM